MNLAILEIVVRKLRFLCVIREKIGVVMMF